MAKRCIVSCVVLELESSGIQDVSSCKHCPYQNGAWSKEQKNYEKQS